MTTALFKIFARKPQTAVAAVEEPDHAFMNARMQRMLAHHVQLNIQPQVIPGAERAS